MGNENENGKESLEQLVKAINTIYSPEVENKLRAIVEKVGAIIRTIAVETSPFMESMQAIAQQMQSVRIQLPKIEVPSELQKKLKKLKYLQLFRESKWPVFFHIDEELMECTTKYLDLSVDEIERSDLDEIIISYFSDDYIKRMTEGWSKASMVSQERQAILSSAVKSFLKEEYIATCCVLMCQMLGLISGSYQEMKQIGIDPPKADIKEAYFYYDPKKIPDKKINMDKERNQLLGLSLEVQSGFMYWTVAIEYIYNTILTSEDGMENSSHPCRNKICHGIQTNINSREHALKAILITDILLHLSEEIMNHPLPDFDEEDM